MKTKNSRLETLRMIISSRELGSQEELLSALQQEGFKLTQATLSRDLKQLKVAKAATLRGNYVYVLPNDTMYKRVFTAGHIREMLSSSDFLGINFSDIPEILGSIAGDDTIFIVIREGYSREAVIQALNEVIK